MDSLIGRHAELERIDTALARRDALPAGLLLHGEAGIGKTVLWQEATRRSREQGFRVLESALTVHESRLAFAGLADLIGGSIGEVLPALAPPQASALEAALALGTDGSAPDERAVAFALHATLAWLARRRPIALAIDDIQWLDPSSTLLLAYAIRRLRGEPVLLLFAQRDGQQPEHGIPITHGTGIEFERIAVGALPMGAIHRMIRTRLGSSLTRPELLRVYAASAGNPLHALELARSIGGTAAADDGLTSLLADRVAALPETARHALALAAVAAESDVEFLAEAYGPGLGSDLGPAIDAELIRVVNGHVRFVHPLMAAAAEGGVSARRRAELHRRLAAATRNPEIRAGHLAQAAEEPDTGVADALDEAARATRRRGARATSASLFEGAARLTPGADPRARQRRLLAAAEAWYEAGDWRHAEEILDALLRDLPAGDERCEAMWQLGIIRDELGEWTEALELWREALAGTRQPILRSRILCSLSITAFYTGSVADAEEKATAAVAAAQDASDPAQLARALAVRALTLAMGGGEGHQPVIDRALALEAGTDESLGEWSPSAIAAECARHTGDVHEAVRHYTTVLQRSVDAGDANQEQWASFGLASSLLMTGDYQRASELADTVLDIADQTGQMRIPARSLRAHVDAYLGRLDDARRLVMEAVEAATAADEATHLFGASVVLAQVESFAGRDGAALDAYAVARRIAGEVGLAHATALRTFLCEAEAAALAGRRDQAEAALAAFEATVDGAPPAWSSALVHRARGAMLAAEGRFRDAQDELAAALAADGILPFDRGRALLASGILARRVREYARARDALGRALETFTALRTPPWIERTQRELERIPGRRSAGRGELTDAESRIAALVAAGRSNKEVAAALFVSVKTVEVTLTRVYEKVGVRSRAELAHRFGVAAKH